MGMADDPRVEVESREAWADWLEANHADAAGAWAVTWKKASGGPFVGYDDLVEEALRFGWVDSVGNRLDDERTMLRFSPRKPGSGWSRPDKERIARLEADGLMESAGIATVESAKRDGSWAALDDVENLVVPADITVAFDAHLGSAEQWEEFPRSVKRGILAWIVSAKRPATREKRIAETAALAARDERANQWTAS